MIERPIRHIIEMQKVLNNIKTYFFKLDELTFGFTSEQKDKYLMLQIQNLKKITKEITKTAAKKDLKQLNNERLVLSREIADEVQG